MTINIAIALAIACVCCAGSLCNRGSDEYSTVVTYIDSSEALSSFLKKEAKEKLGVELPVESLDVFDTLLPVVGLSGFERERFRILFGYDMSDQSVPSERRRADVRQLSRAVSEEEKVPAGAVPIDSSIRRAGPKSKVVLYLSPLKNGIVMAEVVPMLDYRNFLSYDNASYANVTLKFLFHFTSDGELLNVYSSVVFNE
jgi:hypothetical protein